MHAVGAIVYELLFVGRPFATERRRSARGSAEWPKLGPDDPRERFKPLVTQLLDPSPGRRPVQRDDLERLLQEIADGIRGQERTVAIQPRRRESRRTRSVVVLIAAVALAIVALVTCHERSPPGCAGAPAARLDLAGNALRAVPSDARVILTSIVTTDVRRRIQICRTASEAFYVDTAESSGAAGLARSVILHAKARTKANGPPGTVDGVWVAVHTSGATRERLVVYRRPRDGVWCLRAVRGTSVSDVCPTG